MKAIRKKVLNEVIKKAQYGFKPDFPTFSVCMVCGGHTGKAKLKWRNGMPTIKATEEETFMLALINFGYWLHKWEGSNVANAGPKFVPHPCSCDCQHVWVETSCPANHRSGEHTCKCSCCGLETSYDTSD